MEKTSAIINGVKMDIYSLNTVIVGSGAAGLNAADCLHSMGQTDIAVVTEGLNMGTSRNAGSDKQTYYKLNLAGDVVDSPADMAKSLFEGGSMHGDISLIESALSPRSFFKLVEMGVPFPHDEFGAYIGYKTDHDTRQRATSAGPLTSRYMTEKLEERVKAKGIKIFDDHMVIGILTAQAEDGGRYATGLISLDRTGTDRPNLGFTLFNCVNIVYATGGPAGMYMSSAYPENQTGASGIAFEAGVKGINLTESQYGIASVKYRWNLSGSYQQVIPRYVSTRGDGSDEVEFLNGRFSSPGKMLDAIFLKGYQWPFDPRKTGTDGSSLIDILVYEETAVKGRKVWLDYTRNPSCADADGQLDISLLGDEAALYLRNSGALFGKPFDRLMKMNRPAAELFESKGIRLDREFLEIDVCAQHNNGGLLGNIWWESDLRHFFPVGEANGTFGVYRPGGSALNSTQTGSLRAAQYICAKYGQMPGDIKKFISDTAGQVGAKFDFAVSLFNEISSDSNILNFRNTAQARMSANGAHIRSLKGVSESLDRCRDDIEAFIAKNSISSVRDLPYALKNYDIIISQFVYLSAIKEYLERGGGSRGSYVIADDAGGYKPLECDFNDRVCETAYDAHKIRCESEWKPVRPIPSEDGWFENVWADFRANRTIK